MALVGLSSIAKIMCSSLRQIRQPLIIPSTLGVVCVDERVCISSAAEAKSKDIEANLESTGCMDVTSGILRLEVYLLV